MAARCRALSFCLALLGPLPGALAATDYPLEIIQLQGRPSEELVPLVQPFVGEDGAVVGSGDKLILRTSPDRLQQIRILLEQLDRPLRRLVVLVRQGRLRASDRAYAAAGIDLGDDRWRLQAGRPLAPDTGALGLGRESRQEALEVDQRVQVVEGHPAFIRSARVEPPGRHYPGYGYRASGSGFYVLPRLNGEQVTLEISTRLAEPPGRGGAGGIQAVDTRVHGRLGEWISLGGVITSGAASAQGLLRGAAGSVGGSGGIHLLVEELP